RRSAPPRARQGWRGCRRERWLASRRHLVGDPLRLGDGEAALLDRAPDNDAAHARDGEVADIDEIAHAAADVQLPDGLTECRRQTIRRTEGGAAEHHTGDAAPQRVRRDVGIAHAPAQLDRDVHSTRDRGREWNVAVLAGPRSVEIDDVKASRAGGDEAARQIDGVVVERVERADAFSCGGDPPGGEVHRRKDHHTWRFSSLAVRGYRAGVGLRFDAITRQRPGSASPSESSPVVTTRVISPPSARAARAAAPSSASTRPLYA